MNIKRTHIHGSPLDKLVVQIGSRTYTYHILEDLKDTSAYIDHAERMNGVLEWLSGN